MENAVSTAPKGLKNRRYKEWITAYIFIAPTVIGLLLFFIGPIFFSMYISMTEWDNLTPPVFIMFDNYIRMFSDPVMYKELTNTLFYTGVSVPITVVFAIVIANLLNSDVPGSGFFRVVFFIPYVTLPAAAALVWEGMFNVKFGMINGLLKQIGLSPVPWLTDPKYIMGIIIALGVWTAVGYYVIILLVGIKNLPKSYFEAAKIDGATSLQSFMKITIPLLTPQIFFVTIMATISALKVFDPVFIFGKSSQVTRDSIRTMVYGIYEKGFTFYEMGYASAEAVFLLAIIMLVTVIQFVVQKKWVHY